jgi:hypothetical protein
VVDRAQSPTGVPVGGRDRLEVTQPARRVARVRAAEEHRRAVRRGDRREDFIRLVSIENVHRGEHIAKFSSFAHLNSPAIELIGRILERGRAEGLFRREVDAVDAT